jgi:hypothetical protein
MKSVTYPLDEYSLLTTTAQPATIYPKFALFEQTLNFMQSG